jgi:hypothetical protein
VGKEGREANVEISCRPREPEQPVCFIEKNVFTAVASASDMIESTGEFYA